MSERPLPIWDIPTRLTHWLFVGCIAFSWWTAEERLMDWHRYSGYTMSFIGLAPVDDPQLVVAVTLQAPRSALGGGVNAGPVFKQVASFALETLRIPPTGTKRPHIKLTTDGSD